MARKTSEKSATITTKAARRAAPKRAVRLLSGGNPRIALGYGDAPVQTYIAAVPGCKSDSDAASTGCGEAV